MSTHEASPKPLTFSIFKNKDVGDKSNVSWDGKKIRYDKFHTTPDMEYIDYGLSLIDKEYFLDHTPEGPFDFATFLTATCNNDQAQPFVATEIFQEIGSPSGYENFRKMMEKTILISKI